MNNRAIKFRAWDNNLNQLVYPKSFLVEGNVIQWQWDSSVGDYVKSSDVYSQFTGLTLPNGTEIYEGDILNTKAARWEVVFEKGSFVAKWLMEMGDKDTRMILWPMLEHAILLGNRFEHPHILIS